MLPLVGEGLNRLHGGHELENGRAPLQASVCTAAGASTATTVEGLRMQRPRWRVAPAAEARGLRWRGNGCAPHFVRRRGFCEATLAVNGMFQVERIDDGC